MADLTKYVNPALKQGSNFEVHLRHLGRYGKGSTPALRPLNAKFSVDVSFLGRSVKGDIEITMPDTAPQGFCNVDFLGNIRPHCPYHTNRTALTIKVDAETLTISPGSESWTWMDVTGVPVSIGVKPVTAALHDEADAPAAAEA